MNKLLSQIKLNSRSLTIRVVFVMILLVIPLNIWGIFTVSRMQDYMYTEVRNSIYSIGQLKMSDLDARMTSADIYLMDTLMNENSFFSTVLSQKGDAAFYHALYNVHSSLQSRLAPGSDADGYFLYIKDLDYSDVVFRHQQAFNQEKIQESLDALIGNENYQISRQWVLVSYEGELWLMRCVHRRNI